MSEIIYRMPVAICTVCRREEPIPEQWSMAELALRGWVLRDGVLVCPECLQKENADVGHV